MGKFTDEIRRLTMDPGARRMGEIADQLAAQIEDMKQRCCPDGPDLRERSPTPAPAGPAVPSDR